VGDRASSFCLPDTDNKKICLSDFKGKWVVLYFYPKDNTTGCTREAVEFTNALDEFHKLNAVVLGVGADSVQSHQKFVQKHNLRITLLSDAEHEVLKRYGAWQRKKLYGREFWGVVRSTVLIDPREALHTCGQRCRSKVIARM
jgi:peroxiredoxin Q/BCP